MVESHRGIAFVGTICGLKMGDWSVSSGTDVWGSVGIPTYGHDHMGWCQRVEDVRGLKDVLSKIYWALQILDDHCPRVQAVMGACVRGEYQTYDGVSCNFCFHLCRGANDCPG